MNGMSLFKAGIEFNDSFWDESAGYLIAASKEPGRHDTRHSAWYATQLLARNEAGDVARALRIFDHLTESQYEKAACQWYGDYQSSPAQPEPGRPEYPDTTPYTTWDPNVSAFVGCALIIALNDYSSLLPATTIAKIEASLLLAAQADLSRVGGVDGDNLYPCYSNPWLMRTILHAWVGHRLDNPRLKQAGDDFADEVYALWSQHRTLSEFNSPTYTGVSMWALALWNQYAPANTNPRLYGPEMLRETWRQLGQFYNANLQNLAGPWDRGYGFNMTEYVSLVGAVIWGVVGRRDLAPVPKQSGGMYHQGDFAFYGLFALAMPEMLKHLPDEVRQSLTVFQGEHSVTAHAFSPPYDSSPREITAWIGEQITIGAQTIAEKEVGGPAKNPSQFNPAVIQWAMGDSQLGCLSLYPTEAAITAIAARNSLKISYPNASSGAVFTFLFSGLNLRKGHIVTGLDTLPGLKVKVTTNAKDCSVVYDTNRRVNEFIVYRITYAVEAADPFIHLDIQ